MQIVHCSIMHILLLRPHCLQRIVHYSNRQEIWRTWYACDYVTACSVVICQHCSYYVFNLFTDSVLSPIYRSIPRCAVIYNNAVSVYLACAVVSYNVVPMQCVAICYNIHQSSYAIISSIPPKMNANPCVYRRQARLLQNNWGQVQRATKYWRVVILWRLPASIARGGHTWKNILNFLSMQKKLMLVVVQVNVTVKVSNKNKKRNRKYHKNQ